jgi:hypothetical protein
VHEAPIYHGKVSVVKGHLVEGDAGKHRIIEARGSIEPGGSEVSAFQVGLAEGSTFQVGLAEGSALQIARS